MISGANIPDETDRWCNVVMANPPVMVVHGPDILDLGYVRWLIGNPDGEDHCFRDHGEDRGRRIRNPP